MKEMIRKYRGTLISSALVILQESWWVLRVYKVSG